MPTVAVTCCNRDLPGMLPFGGSAKEMIEGHLTQTPVPLASMPANTVRVIDKLLAKDPDQRYQTAADVRV